MKEKSPGKWQLKTRRRLLVAVALLLAAMFNARHIVCAGIVVYQKCVSPCKGWHCAHGQFHGGPSCSEYGKRVIADHGVLRGYVLLQERFKECAAAAALLRARQVASGNDNCGDKELRSCSDGCKAGCVEGAKKGGQ
jgi:putative component of membrane protein insertase Oxa1/YidC/SpoIIIJ protein YidD